MSRDRAAYMREYRKRNKKGLIAELEFRSGLADDIRESMEETIRQQSGRIAELDARNVGLEEEVRHLKAELAKRPATRELIERSIATAPRRTHTGHRDGNPGAASDRFNTRPFTPVPKRK